MSLSCRISSEADMPFVRCFEQVENQRALWDLIRSCSGRDFP